MSTLRTVRTAFAHDGLVNAVGAGLADPFGSGMDTRARCGAAQEQQGGGTYGGGGRGAGSSESKTSAAGAAGDAASPHATLHQATARPRPPR